MKKNNQSAANPCQKYGIAITDYVLGEPMDISYEELLNHLKECAACQKDFADWRSTYAALRTEAYHKTPEAKKRYAELLAKIKNLPALSGKQPIDAKVDIDSATEKIYHCLKADDKIAIPVLRKETGLVDYPFYEAMGVLITNGKVIVDKDKDNRPAYVSAQLGA